MTFPLILSNLFRRSLVYHKLIEYLCLSRDPHLRISTHLTSPVFTMTSAPSASQAPSLPTSYGNLRDLLPSHWTTSVTSWLAEDTPSFDYGGFVVGSSPRTAQLLCKSPGILAGQPFVEEIFRQLDCTVRWTDGYTDGDFIDPKGGKINIASVSGPTRKLLLGSGSR